MLLPTILLLFTTIFCWGSPAVSPVANDNGRLASTELYVDGINHARVYYNKLQIIVGLADFFELFSSNIIGGRNRIVSGPWNGPMAGKVTQRSDGGYAMSGEDPDNGFSYGITVDRSVHGGIEVTFRFQAPRSRSNLSFEVVKLSGDLFKGAILAVTPASTRDARAVPELASSLERRILAAGKNKVVLEGVVCNVEITDSSAGNSLLVADFRNVPWEWKKSITIVAEKAGLEPGKEYAFRYSIRCLPPTQMGRLLHDPPPGSGVVPIDTWSFLSPVPKEETLGSGFYRLRPSDGIFGDLVGVPEITLLHEIEKITSWKLSIRPYPISHSERGIRIERVPIGQSSRFPAEGYELTVTPEAIVVRGVDNAGCLYGVYALLERIGGTNTDRRIPCGVIRDWPDLPIRGICVEMLPPALRDTELFRKYLDAFSRARGNVVVFLHEPKSVLSWKENRDDGGWTPSQAAEIAAYARSLQMQVWAGMSSKYDRGKISGVTVSEGATIYDPLDNKSYETVFSLYEELIRTYRPTTFLAGHDEIRGLSVYATRYGKSEVDLLTADINRIHEWLSQKKVGMALWGDMFLDFQQWNAATGNANGNNQAFRSGATPEVLSKVPKDVLILDWHYSFKKEFRSIEYFRKNGLRTVGASWFDPLAAKSLAKSAKRFDGQGIIGTDWGFWRTLSPTATTLYAPLCGWNTGCSIGEDNEDVKVLSRIMRDQSYSAVFPSQHSVDIKKVCNRSTSDVAPGKGTGVFDIGPVLDLRGITSGVSTHNGIAFKILPAINSGGGKNCIVVGNSRDPLDDVKVTTIIPLGKVPARAIAFLHTAFFRQPSFRSRQVGNYTLVFRSGRTAKLDLVEGWNITDVRSSEAIRTNDWGYTRGADELIGAEHVWNGLSAAGIPLNLQVLVWRNPYPDDQVEQIKLSVSNASQRTEVALLGVTLLN